MEEAKGGVTALHQDLTLAASHAEDCLYWSCLKSELYVSMVIYKIEKLQAQTDPHG
jgi:hypothetical protein